MKVLKPVSGIDKASQTMIIIVPVVFVLSMAIIVGVYLCKRYRNSCNCDAYPLHSDPGDLQMNTVQEVPFSTAYDEISHCLYQNINREMTTGEHPYEVVSKPNACTKKEMKSASKSLHQEIRTVIDTPEHIYEGITTKDADPQNTSKQVPLRQLNERKLSHNYINTSL